MLQRGINGQLDARAVHRRSVVPVERLVTAIHFKESLSGTAAQIFIVRQFEPRQSLLVYVDVTEQVCAERAVRVIALRPLDEMHAAQSGMLDRSGDGFGRLKISLALEPDEPVFVAAAGQLLNQVAFALAEQRRERAGDFL